MAQSCRDIDELHESSRELQVLSREMIRKITEVDEHLKNGLGTRIEKAVTDLIERKRNQHDRTLKWVLAAFAIIEAVSFISARVTIG